MSIAEHHGWIFSKNEPPKIHKGGLFPIKANGLVKPWVYLEDMNQWYVFNEDSWVWHIVFVDTLVPKEYLVQLTLLK